MEKRTDIRNVAIIAHVDHGKTTLVDALLKQSNTFRNAEAMGTTIMDSNELERERGITIFSKNAAIVWNGVKINIVDTPGHADFGGEVERIMSMVDGCLLLVDAKEGPMPQTKFVLKKAIAAGHKVVVVINKIDKKDARPEWVLNKTFDLFVDLGATDEQANFPVIYASAIQGLAGRTPELSLMKDVTAIYETIVSDIPGPTVDADGPMQMSVVNVQYDAYKGRLAVGRLVRGTMQTGQSVTHIHRDGTQAAGRVTTIEVFAGLARTSAEEVHAGDILAVAGIEDVGIGETLADAEAPEALPVLEIEEPTVKMTFAVNTSPFAGREGEFATSRHLKARLDRELQNDVALRVEEGSGEGAFIVSGRGELHLAILIEKMRREGYELQVSRPQVIMKTVNKVEMEPFEQVSIEVPENMAGIVIEHMGKRRGEMNDMKVEGPTAFLEFEIPTRGLIGFRNEFLTDTKGQGIMNSLLLGYRPRTGEVATGVHGSMISMENGATMGYALTNLQERGMLFLGPGVEVYEGMVVGEHSRPEDIEVNPCKEKKLSNMRSKGDGVSVGLAPYRDMTLEQCLEYIGDDELVEVTPKNIRMRKAILVSHLRRRANAAAL
ncbi:translational GTPase TypA [Candidatus Uhrbacteria bacterium]|nr:translational GTPase TypA [Candidatus Uhrbacteria bacterium]